MERFDIYDKDRQLTGRTAERGQALGGRRVSVDCAC